MSKTGTIVLGPIERTSPTLWAEMRLCRLRALLALAAPAQIWVLHDPRIWLGTAFHNVMKAAAAGDAGSLDSVWKESVDELASRAAEHPLDQRFRTPEKWPSYYIVKQRALALAADKTRMAPAASAGRAAAPAAPPRGAERWFEARGGKLVGRPDYYDGTAITEYKSNLPNPAWPMAAVILEGFRRQLRLYAAIIGEVTGRYPSAGRVVAASGEVLNVEIDKQACIDEADAAVSALDALNGLISSEVAPDKLAAASPAQCPSCSFKLICDQFWRSFSQADWAATSGTALAGMVKSIQRGTDGDLYSIDLEVKASSHIIPRGQRIVLRKSIHGDLTSAVGRDCRLVDGRLGADGRVRAEMSTIIAQTNDLPTLVTPALAQ